MPREAAAGNGAGLPGLGAALVLVLLALPVRGAEPPEQAVQRFETALVDAMKVRRSLDFEKRFERLLPVIGGTFDLPYMAQVVLGRHWEGLSDGQRDQFVALFRELVVSSFAGEVGEYEGEVFRFDEVKPLKRGRMLVRSQLVDLDGDSDHFDYVLHQARDGWQIVNLVVNGVSDLALKRAEYASLIERDGFKGLVERIRAQIDTYRKRI